VLLPALFQRGHLHHLLEVRMRALALMTSRLLLYFVNLRLMWFMWFVWFM
jgi:hypothetical protein